MAFIGRDDDLKQLQECFTERRAQLVFVYGRRRVGKTETLIQLAKDKETLFFAAQNATKDEQLASFSPSHVRGGCPGQGLSESISFLGKGVNRVNPAARAERWRPQACDIR